MFCFIDSFRSSTDFVAVSASSDNNKYAPAKAAMAVTARNIGFVSSAAVNDLVATAAPSAPTAAAPSDTARASLAVVAATVAVVVSPNAAFTFVSASLSPVS